jgi:hypothetical protein
MENIRPMILTLDMERYFSTVAHSLVMCPRSSIAARRAPERVSGRLRYLKRKATKLEPKGSKMKIVILIARLLLGLVFVVFGLNGFLNFLSMGPMPSGLAGQFIGALVLSHYFWVVAALQIAGGALLLVNRFRTPRSGAAWTSNCEHCFISLIPESKWCGAGNRRSGPVVGCLL